MCYRNSLISGMTGLFGGRLGFYSRQVLFIKLPYTERLLWTRPSQYEVGAEPLSPEIKRANIDSNLPSSFRTEVWNV
jgi:hypothetical protein